DLGETAVAQAAAELIDRRAGSEQGTPGLSPELLWDHRVDARVGSFIAVGAALGRGEEGIDEHQYEQRRREAMVTVDQAPAGHDGAPGTGRPTSTTVTRRCSPPAARRPVRCVRPGAPGTDGGTWAAPRTSLASTS